MAARQPLLEGRLCQLVALPATSVLRHRDRRCHRYVQILVSDRAVLARSDCVPALQCLHGQSAREGWLNPALSRLWGQIELQLRLPSLPPSSYGSAFMLPFLYMSARASTVSTRGARSLSNLRPDLSAFRICPFNRRIRGSRELASLCRSSITIPVSKFMDASPGDSVMNSLSSLRPWRSGAGRHSFAPRLSVQARETLSLFVYSLSACAIADL